MVYQTGPSICTKRTVLGDVFRTSHMIHMIDGEKNQVSTKSSSNVFFGSFHLTSAPKFLVDDSRLLAGTQESVLNHQG